MFFNDTLEEKIKHNKKKTKEIDIRLEKLDLDISKFLNELPLTIEQLNTFLENPVHFNEEEWHALQSLKTKLDQRLELELNNIRDPNKAKKAFDDRNVQRHWLYVK